MEDRTEPKSKSQVKREMIALQSLGQQLLDLSPDQLEKIEMPQELREVVLFTMKMKKGEARRRQMQYIGVLMRDADPEPIRKALDQIGRGRSIDAQLLQKIEKWRDGLIAGNEALIDEILDALPGADRQRLRQLVANARKESEKNKPPKSSRALFRYLRELSEAEGTSETNESL